MVYLVTDHIQIITIQGDIGPECDMPVPLPFIELHDLEIESCESGHFNELIIGGDGELLLNAVELTTAAPHQSAVELGPFEHGAVGCQNIPVEVSDLDPVKIVLESRVSSTRGDGTISVDLRGGQEGDREMPLFRGWGQQFSRDIAAAIPFREPEHTQSRGGVDPFRGIRTAQCRFDEVIGNLETVQGLLPDLEDHRIPDARSDSTGSYGRVLNGFGEIAGSTLHLSTGVIVPAILMRQKTVGPHPAGMNIYLDLARWMDPGP